MARVASRQLGGRAAVLRAAGAAEGGHLRAAALRQRGREQGLEGAALPEAQTGGFGGGEGVKGSKKFLRHLGNFSQNPYEV